VTLPEWTAACLRCLKLVEAVRDAPRLGRLVAFEGWCLHAADDHPDQLPEPDEHCPNCVEWQVAIAANHENPTTVARIFVREERLHRAGHVLTELLNEPAGGR
jgi:hypothetical protein